MKEKHLTQDFEEMPKEELADKLRQFYPSAHVKDKKNRTVKVD